jgi:restriction system protein
MAARQGLVDDLLHISSRLSWRASLLVAMAAALALHLAAVALTVQTPAASTADLGAFAARTLFGTVARLMQFVIPPVFLVGALVSYLRRSQASSLFQQAKIGASDAVGKMPWPQFERLVGEAFRRRGFEVTETGGQTADGGVDLVLSKDRKRYLVQCKHWRAQSVGVSVVRELNGVVAARRAAGGYVVTSGMFTQEAAAFARSCRIELIDGQGLAYLIGQNAAKRVDEGSTSDAPCPNCGSTMVRRVAKQGTSAGQAFWGCSRYPACRGTRPIA